MCSFLALHYNYSNGLLNSCGRYVAILLIVPFIVGGNDDVIPSRVVGICLTHI